MTLQEYAKAMSKIEKWDFKREQKNWIQKQGRIQLEDFKNNQNNYFNVPKSWIIKKVNNQYENFES